MRLEDRVAIITGAGQGIGRVDAQRLVAEGARVVVAELNEAKGKAVAEEITVNCITPGATYTEIPRETVTPAQKEAMIRTLCIKRAEEPTDLEGTVVFLASDDAAFITGQTINVDGGMNLH